MARLPEPGGDDGQWGQLLNEYLTVSHTTDGSLKSNSVNSNTLADASVTASKLSTTGQPTSGQALTFTGGQLSWTTPSDAGPVSDATASAKGVIQLAGDLGGTAASPTVPGLTGKEPTVVPGTTSQYYRGDKSWQTLNKATVGLANVDNTADIDKPISTLTQTALDAKASSDSLSTVATSGNYNDLSNRPTIPTISDASTTEKGVIQLTGDLGGTAASPIVPGLAGKADATHSHDGADITAGTITAARLPLATEAAAGIVELATVEEATTGTDTTRAVTAAGVKAAVDATVATVPQVLFVNSLSQLPPGTPVDTLVVVRAA